MNTIIKDARSSIDSRNLQEILDAAVSTSHALQSGQQQYQTPPWLARAQSGLLPFRIAGNEATIVYDPQCAGGNLLLSVPAMRRYGMEVDKRFVHDSDPIGHRITGSCVKAWEIAEDAYGQQLAIKFQVILANPPFGIRWKHKDKTIDSTEWTWETIKKRLLRGGCGYLISNADTIQRLKINEDPWVYLFQRFPAGGIWDDCEVKLGVVHFINNDPDTGCQRVDHQTYVHDWDAVPSEFEVASLSSMLGYEPKYRFLPYPPYFEHQWAELRNMVHEESGSHSKWNIFLNEEGVLRTYLSTRQSMKLQATDIQNLARINGCRPLTLTTEREPRKVLHRFLTAGIYTIEPEARDAILDALTQVASMACPIRPVTDFELVAYADEEDSLECIAKDQRGRLKLTIGKRYEIKTGSYNFTERYVTKKLYFDEEEGTTELKDHDCELHGQDRYIELVDDHGVLQRFMDKPTKGVLTHHPESILWDLFKKPYVPTVKEVQEEDYNRNVSIMEANELLNRFNYFPGQKDYYARMGCKDYGVIGADVGTGKTLGALTMVALKSPKRTLIIAPQGTMRSSGEEDDVEEYQASQWVQEIRRFAPTEPVFQLFCVEDWRNILRANGGELPAGIFITYPQAYFSNGAFESIPATWKESEVEKKFCKLMDLPWDEERTDPVYSPGVGQDSKGIRCIANPSLHTLMDLHHGFGMWEMVIVDEAHLICNLESRITKNLLRVQPKHRFLMTATPIPNFVGNLFSLMGWVCVPNWYKGDLCNAAWPYTVADVGRFETTFSSTELDLTAAAIAKAKGKKNPRTARRSPIISSPARLLKLLKPSLAYISKEDCNPDLQPCEVIDVRVKNGRQQGKLYEFWLNRANYVNEYKNALTVAMVQSARLRGVCAAPSSLAYTRGMCFSNFNPKTVTILGLTRDRLREGEQVVVVCARVGQTEEIAARLRESNVPIARIDSTTPAELHTAEANRFKRGDARVMLMGIKCAQGHSFDQCPNLIIGSLEWSYGSLHQAKGRVWRLTSRQPVRVWCVLHKGSIEEMLFDRVALKQDAATICLRGQRVPRDFKPFDAAEVLAEHIVNFDASSQELLSEIECEQQWPELRAQLALAAMPIRRDKAEAVA